MSNSPPINDKARYRVIVLAAVKLLKRRRPYRGNVLLISRSLCIKHGPLVSLAEASSMRFISQSSSMPVPRIIGAFETRGHTYIVMERINGDQLGVGWMKRSPESQADILAQLKRMIQEMRKIPPAPSCGVTNVDGGSLFDCRLPGASLRFGPINSIQDFHRHLRGGVHFNAGNNPDVNQLVHLHRQDWPLVFTHGDLSSLNILVRGDKVEGIVDWETAGWFPAYWEYTTAYQVNPQNYFWRESIDLFLDPFPSELIMEEMRRKYFGDF